MSYQCTLVLHSNVYSISPVRSVFLTRTVPGPVYSQKNLNMMSDLVGSTESSVIPLYESQ